MLVKPNESTEVKTPSKKRESRKRYLGDVILFCSKNDEGDGCSGGGAVLTVCSRSVAADSVVVRKRSSLGDAASRVVFWFRRKELIVDAMLL